MVSDVRGDFKMIGWIMFFIGLLFSITIRNYLDIIKIKKRLKI